MNNRRAVILFVRDEREEAAVKPLPGQLRAEGYRAINARIADRLGGVERHGVDLVVVGASEKERIVQRGSSFGERISNAITDTFAHGYAQVVVVGNDCPTMTCSDLLRAFDKLCGGASVVAAPARDGGAFLVGAEASRFDAEAFTALPWQTPQLFTAFRSLAGAAVLPIVRDDYDSWMDHRAERALMRLLGECTLRPTILFPSFPLPSTTTRKARSRVFLTAPPAF